MSDNEQLDDKLANAQKTSFVVSMVALAAFLLPMLWRLVGNARQ